MTNMVISETIHADTHHAGNKARADAEVIIVGLGFEKLGVDFQGTDRDHAGIMTKVLANVRALHEWVHGTRQISSGDTVVIQYPPDQNNTIFFGSVMRKLSSRGVRVILLVHDIDSLRYCGRGAPPLSKMRARHEDGDVLAYAETVIVHNDKMRDALLERGLITDQRVISLELFDYLIDNHAEVIQGTGMDLPVVVAGNLMPEKAGYVYDLPGDVRFNLYGPNCEEASLGSNASYQGSFRPDVLPSMLSGSYGLVWDGQRVETCDGAFGNYLRYNNPHKLSLYLASGMPVIVWRGAAVAKFVEEHGVGLCIDDLRDLGEQLRQVAPAQYKGMVANARELRERVTRGHYLRRAMERCA